MNAGREEQTEGGHGGRGRNGRIFAAIILAEKMLHSLRSAQGYVRALESAKPI